jgi:glutamate/tyrosine decarboxylase-like PLP-dependent enzyme
VRTLVNRRLLSALSELQKEQWLSLDRTGDHTPETWFIGPKGENAGLFKRLVARAIDHHIAFRHDYMPDDPPIHRDPEAPAIQASETFIAGRLEEMLDCLRGSVPLASFRNLSHMYWDQALPAVVGYISALLYNQNNVAAEASPATTLLEIEVGNDLCRMLGYPLPNPEAIAHGAIKPWGHITCDGSVANGESVWASRNVKYFAVAMAEAIRAGADMAPARNTTVKLLDGHRARLLDLTPWQLMNLPIDEVLGLAPRVSKVAGLPPAVLDAAMSRHSVQALGLVAFHRRYLGEIEAPVLLAPATAHYSWPKSMGMMGLGRESLRPIQVDQSGRMDMVALRAVLDTCLEAKQPVMQVTAVLGSTEESAVDPVADILAIRDEYRALGLEFSVHADGAWGGYFASMLRAPHGQEGKDTTNVTRTEADAWHALMLGDGTRAPGIMLSPYVMRQMLALPGVDSITVDPHKAGFAPYPAGALCYRNGAMRDMVSFKAPVVFHGGIDPTVGVYGIEGSKPGAAAAAVYLAHRVIRTDRSGYGDLLARCQFNAKRFYAMLVNLAGPDFTVTPFQRLPAETVPGATKADIAAQKQQIVEDILPLKDADLVAALREDSSLFALFRDMGPDLTITTYAFNFVTAQGVNADQALMNEMNDIVYRRLSLQSFNGGVITTTPMFVTSSDFDPALYGQDFVSDFASRAGVMPTPGLPVNFLISTTQNPWLSEAGGGHVLATLRGVLAETASDAAQAVMARHGITPPS